MTIRSIWTVIQAFVFRDHSLNTTSSDQNNQEFQQMVYIHQHFRTFRLNRILAQMHVAKAGVYSTALPVCYKYIWTFISYSDTIRVRI